MAQSRISDDFSKPTGARPLRASSAARTAARCRRSRFRDRRRLGMDRGTLSRALCILLSCDGIGGGGGAVGVLTVIP
jgi:hypothetical protein